MINEFVFTQNRKLRCGYTTGSCAAAAAKAASIMLLTGEIQHEVVIDTPMGIRLTLVVEDIMFDYETVSCAITKDGGDDIDCTSGIKIYARVQKSVEGVQIEGGVGVGKVTRVGLACAVGEAAINPVPQKMILQCLKEVAEKYSYDKGFNVVISVPEGEEKAKDTFNPRLGIVGGISILGTSGIVEPMSEKAIIDTIRLEIDSKIAAGAKTLLICPGNYGRDFAKSNFGIDIDEGVKCSNFIGETLDYAVFKGIKKILLIGHAGKLTKIAAGVMNTHSRVADCRNEIFAAHAALAGADAQMVRRLMNAVTTDEMDTLLQKWGLAQAVWNSILDKVRFHINHRTREKCRTEIVVFTNLSGAFLQTTGAGELISELRNFTFDKKNS